MTNNIEEVQEKKMVKTIEEVLEKKVELEKLYNEAQEELILTQKVNHEKYNDCIKLTQECIKFLDDQNPFLINRNKDEVFYIYLISSELLVRSVGIGGDRKNITENEKNILYVSVSHLKKTLALDPLHLKAKELYKIVMLYLTSFSADFSENIKIIKQILTVDPYDFQIHFNLGFMYGHLNELEQSMYHYKLALFMIEKEKELCKLKNINDTKGLDEFTIKCLNGIGTIYFHIQDRDTALYYFYKAYDINQNDPDVNNQIGVTYTEIRNTEKAMYHYNKGIEHYKEAIISQDKDMLIASMYMNRGLVLCYECNFTDAIESYNQALKYKPRLSLAYQNKLLDLNYISHLIEDPLYIAKLHKAINKIYPTVVKDYKQSLPEYKVKDSIVSCKNYKSFSESDEKINIGFVSGDFICHPVSYFIHCILQNIDYTKFNVYCYSMKPVNLTERFKECNWFFVKNKSPEELKELISSHGVDMLFDLSTHTGDNRLDTFVLKPAPIQISYCGYPNTAGVVSMDYRLTDKICDSKKSEKYYSEKLVYLPNSFLCYTPPTGIENPPPISEGSPYYNNNYITFGCFNRYNKINKSVVSTWEKILKSIPNARLIVKTKEFTTPKLKKQFLDSFDDQSVIERVKILPYSDTFVEHLQDYNLIDVALDTFPYSGTTTSCESLFMGVPILTLYDNVRFYHSQNVTSSLLENSGLKSYITYSKKQYIDKAIDLSKNFSDNKVSVRSGFINGHVCNYKEFITNFQNTLFNLYKNHKW